MTRRDLWDAAANASLDSPYKQFRIGAATKVRNTIVTGFNQPRSHPLQKKYTAPERKNWRTWYKDNPFLHAEIALLTQIRAPISEVWIFRYNRKGDIATCRPCSGCMAALKAFGVRRIHYTTETGYCTEVI